MNCGKRDVLSLVKGDVKRKVLMPIRIRELRLVKWMGVSKGNREGCVVRAAYCVVKNSQKVYRYFTNFLYRRSRGGWIWFDWV